MEIPNEPSCPGRIPPSVEGSEPDPPGPPTAPRHPPGTPPTGPNPSGRDWLGPVAEAVLRDLREWLMEHDLDSQTVKPTTEDSLETAGFLLWTMAGLRVFGRPTLPSFSEATGQARRVLLLLASARCHGNISHMAAVLDVSRRTVRESMRRHGLYHPTNSCRGSGRREPRRAGSNAPTDRQAPAPEGPTRPGEDE